MIVSVDVRDAELLLRLRNGSKRMVYAIAGAARATALEVQKVQRAGLGQRITLRDKADFLKRQAAVITFPRPKEGVLEAAVRIGQKEGLYLSGLETGFERRPRVGANVAVPVGARPTETAPIPESLYIRRLGLRRRSSKRAGGRAGTIAGRYGTYLVPEVGIFQRTGSGPSRLLYALHDPFRVSPRLRWLSTSRAVVERFFVPELRRQIFETLRFQRLRGTL